MRTIAGVVGVAIGAVDGQPVIKLVIKKTPALEQKIPKMVEGYPVMLEETGEIRADRKFTHIEGSCQETKLPLPQLLTTFSRCALLSKLRPRLVASDASLFSFTWCRLFWRRTIHPSGSRPQDVAPPRLDVGPWHVACPRKPSVPCRI